MLNLPHLSFGRDMAAHNVRLVEDAWNSRDPELVSQCFAHQAHWQSNHHCLLGQQSIAQHLSNQWKSELHFRHIKELWAAQKDRLCTRFVSEWRTMHNKWFRTHGSEFWELDENGLLSKLVTCIHTDEITEDSRLFKWPFGPRPSSHPSLSEMGL